MGAPGSREVVGRGSVRGTPSARERGTPGPMVRTNPGMAETGGFELTVPLRIRRLGKLLYW